MSVKTVPTQTVREGKREFMGFDQPQLIVVGLSLMVSVVLFNTLVVGKGPLTDVAWLLPRLAAVLSPPGLALTYIFLLMKGKPPHYAQDFLSSLVGGCEPVTRCRPVRWRVHPLDTVGLAQFTKQARRAAPARGVCKSRR